MTALLSVLANLPADPSPSVQQDRGVKAHPYGWFLWSDYGAKRPATHQSGGGGSECAWLPVTGIAERPQTPGGSWYRIECPNKAVQYQWVPRRDPGPAVTPQELMQRAARDLRLPVPVVLTAPPRESDAMVGIPVWLWVAPGQWRPITRRVQAGPVWAQVVATPRQLVIEPGYGQQGVRCQGPGRPYAAGLAAAAPGSCTYTFTRSSAGLPALAYAVKASVVWNATWDGSGGAGGALAPQVSSTTFNVRVAEGQALVTAPTEAP
jgi:hypothetical protein